MSTGSDTLAPPPGPATPGPVDDRGIRVTGVHRAFGDVRALDGVDLVARPGAVTALVGPNGSGKTTLLLVLAGLLVPDAGEVRVAGHDPVRDGRAARARTGWMPDAFGTWDSLTAREVLLTFAAAYRLPRAVAADRTAELLETVHLAEFADRPASALSRGQKQRLGLARALVHRPDVLLLDEPASGLDPRSRVELRVLLRRLADDGATVLVSSHVLTELDEMADDAVFLSRGRTVVPEAPGSGPGGAPEWRLRALDVDALTAWLTSVGAAWRPDDALGTARDGSGPDASAGADPTGVEPVGGGPGGAAAGGPRAGGVVLPVAGEAGAARLLRDAVAAGIPVTSLAPSAGSLERAYLTLEEDRR